MALSIEKGDADESQESKRRTGPSEDDPDAKAKGDDEQVRKIRLKFPEDQSIT